MKLKNILISSLAFLLITSSGFSQCEVTIDGNCQLDVDIIRHVGIFPEPAVSDTNTAKTYFNESEGKLKCSEGGGAYTDCVGGAGSGDVTASSNLGDNLLIRGDGATKGVQNSGISISDGDIISNVTDPVLNQDVATKEYHDTHTGGTAFDFSLSDTADGAFSTLFSTPTGEAQTTDSVTAASETSPGTLIEDYITESGEPTFVVLSEGIYDMHIHAHVDATAGTDSARVLFELYSSDSAGANQVLLMTSEESAILTTVETEYDLHASKTSETAIGLTDRLVLKVYAILEAATGQSDPVVTITMEGVGANDTQTRLTVKTTATVFDDRYLKLDGSKPMAGILETSNGSILANATASGVVTLGGVGGTFNENLTFDFESFSNIVELSIPTGSQLRMKTGDDFALSDGSKLRFGASSDVDFEWETTGNDNLQIGTNVGSAAATGYISIMEKGDMGNANRSPDADWVNGATPADPTFCVTSSDATNKLDHGCQWHDQTDYNIASGAGDINIISAVDVKLNPTATGNVTLFEDTDVDDAADGKKFIIYRKAAEGDSVFQTWFDSFNVLLFQSTRRMKFESTTAQIDFNPSANGDATFFIDSTSGENRFLKQAGYITAAGDEVEIQWQVNDTTDNFELTRENSNIGAFDIQMPLITDEITTSGPITITSGDSSVEFNNTITADPCGTGTVALDTGAIYFSSGGFLCYCDNTATSVDLLVSSNGACTY